MNQLDPLPQMFFKGALRPDMPALVTLTLSFGVDAARYPPARNRLYNTRTGQWDAQPSTGSDLL